MQALGKLPSVELGWRSRGRWQWLLMAIAAALLGLPERLLAQAYRAAPETMQIEDQPGYVPDPEAERLPAIYQRQMVFYRTTEAPGTIIVQTSERYLYVVQPNSRAIRYGIGVGRDGFQWSGLLKITRKAEWPDWNPPPEMIARQPYLPRFMAGGPGNPLGARALYLGSTVYRIHGTNQPQTIGQSISSGCFRLVNGDVIDLYDRIPVGTKVIVRQTPET
jgi:lipoprotein-anchoring transpeptidase ErfK/SrfK